MLNVERDARDEDEKGEIERIVEYTISGLRKWDSD